MALRDFFIVRECVFFTQFLTHVRSCGATFIMQVNLLNMNKLLPQIVSQADIFSFSVQGGKSLENVTF